MTDSNPLHFSKIFEFREIQNLMKSDVVCDNTRTAGGLRHSFKRLGYKSADAAKILVTKFAKT